MKFVSTRHRSMRFSIDEALLAGLAPDGGLFVPELLPKGNSKVLPTTSMADFAAELLKIFFNDSVLLKVLPEICERAFGFETPLKRLNKEISVLELTHGPTCAFKDVGAQFLAAAMKHLRPDNNKPRVVLVATSGDTGGAVGCAFSGQENTRVIILYPKGRISDRQERQLTCWQKNVSAYAVKGTFDECQKMVKAAFTDSELQKNWQLLSANSISLGRLLPQMIYYAYTAATAKTSVNFIIPTGNLGNALAAVWAKELGFNIDKICLALNANSAIAEFLKTKEWHPKETIATLANAMDVGNASNMERLRDLLSIDPQMYNSLTAWSVSDAEIRETIQRVYKEFNYVTCPHTACAFYAQTKMKWSDSILISTADAAKFNDLVEPIIKRPIEAPSDLERILGRPFERKEIAANEAALKALF